MQLSFPEFLAAVWRGRLVIVLALVVAGGAAVAAVRLQKPEYQSTATIQLTTASNDLSLLSHVDAVSAVYAEALEAQATADQARAKLDGRLADINVRTFTGSPILKVDAQSTDASLARSSAQAVVDVVSAQSQQGSYGYSGVRLLEIQPPLLATDPVSPRPRLTYALAGVVGLVLGVAGALIIEATRRSRSSGVTGRFTAAARSGRAPRSH